MDDAEVTSEWLDRLVELDDSVRTGRDSETKLIDPDWESARRILSTLKELYAPGQPAPAHMPRQIGSYRIERMLGAGGFAAVYLGHDTRLNRDVAVKVLHPAVLLNPQSRQRFLREAQSAARLDHPHIVPAFEAGDDGSIPYIAYAYCPGVTLATWREQHGSMEPKQASRLVEQLADAVQYSHQQGVLHRDIKPANILLFPPRSDGLDQLPFVPRLGDFGIAKLIEEDLEHTASSVMLGTPRYMAPEQLDRQHSQAGEATDIYGLGAVLYELLTAQPPFTATTTWDILTQVRNYPPAAPRLLRPSIPPDLETICLKCLAKDPRERYASARALADDLARFRQGWPVLARRTSWPQVAWRWAARHRVVTALLVTLVGSLVGITVGAAYHAISVDALGRELTVRNEALSNTVSQLNSAISDSRRMEQRATDHAKTLDRTVYSLEIGRAAQAWRLGDVKTVKITLQPFQHVTVEGEDLREFAWRYLWRQQEMPEIFRDRLPAPQYMVRFSPAGDLLAAAGADSILRLYSVPGFERVREIPTGQREINDVAFDPDHAQVATTGDDGTLAVWSLQTGERQAIWHFFDKQAFQVVLSQPLKLYAVCGTDPVIHLISTDTEEKVGELKGVHTRGVESLSVSPEGLRLLSCGTDDRAVIWNLETRDSIHELKQNGYVASGAWSHDGRHVATAPREKRVRLWQSLTGQDIGAMETVDAVHSLAANGAGRTIAGDQAGSLYLLPCVLGDDAVLAGTQPVEGRWSIHDGRIYALDFSPDGSLIVSASKDGSIAAFQFQLPLKNEVLPAQIAKSHARECGPAADGSTFALAGSRILLKPNGQSAAKELNSPGRFWAMAADRQGVWGGDDEGRLHRWTLADGFAQARMDSPLSGKALANIIPLGSNRLLLKEDGGSFVLWNIQSQTVDREFPEYHHCVISPDGEELAVIYSPVRRLAVLEPTTFRELRSIDLTEKDSNNVLAYSAHGRFIILGGNDRAVRVFDRKTLREIWTLLGHVGVIYEVCTSPDEKTLASAGADGSVRLWDLRSGRELFQLHQHEESIRRLRFTADGEDLLGSDASDNELRWSTRAQAE